MKRWRFRLFVLAFAGAAVSFALSSRVMAGPPDESAIATGKSTQTQADFQRQLDDFQFNNRMAANPEIPADQRALIDYGGYVNFSYLSADDPAQNTHILFDEQATGYANLSLDNADQVFFRGHVEYRTYGDGDGLPGGIEGNGEHSAIDQLYYQFDLKGFLAAYSDKVIHNDAAIKLGRQTVLWGNGLVFNQNLDAGVADFTAGGFTLEAVGGITVPDTIDFDTSRPGFDNSTDRGFFGALLSYQVGRNTPYAYFLAERDYNRHHTLLTTIGANTYLTNFSYNADYAGIGSKGSLSDNLLYGLEAAGEGGDTLSNSYIIENTGPEPVNQQFDPIDAFAFDGRLQYLLNDTRGTQITFESTVASGDHDRFSTNDTFGGNKPGTRDQAFNGFGLLNTGVAFAPQVSNVVITRLGFATSPLNDIPIFRKLQIGADVFMFDKFLAGTPIDETSTSGVYLGWEPDVYVNWQITSDLSLAIRYGSFFPGGTISKVDGDRSRQLFYSGVTLAF